MLKMFAATVVRFQDEPNDEPPLKAHLFFVVALAAIN